MKPKKKNKKRYPLKVPLLSLFIVFILILMVFFFLTHASGTKDNTTILPHYSPTIAPFPTPTVDPTIPTWKAYINNAVGYSIKTPPEWKVDVSEDTSILQHQEASSMDMNADPPGTIWPNDPNSASMTIDFPISIHGQHTDIGEVYAQDLQGIANTWGANPIQYTQIAGRRALIGKTVSASTPPPNFGGDWCDTCSTKYVYIALDSEHILTIQADWGKARTEFEQVFDTVVSTIHFFH